MIGVAVRDGAPVPDISTVDALKARLIAAKSVAWIDPKVGGAAGAAIVILLQKMDIADEVMKKSVYGKTGAEAVQKMAAGEADIAISFISEIKPIKGAKVVGPLPAAVQSPATYAGAVGVNSANPERRARASEDHGRRGGAPGDGGSGAGAHRALGAMHSPAVLRRNDA